MRAGGGVNHRFGLYDAVLVKDNHIAAAGGIANALDDAPRAHRPSGEDRGRGGDASLSSKRRCAYPIDAVLLDNMDVATMKKAVELVNGRVVTEASGGVTPRDRRGDCEDRRRCDLGRGAYSCAA